MAFPFLAAALLARGNRRQRRSHAKQRQAEGRLVFEALEPRVLLSADPLSVSLSGNVDHPIAHDVIIESVTQTLANSDHTTVQMVQVVEHGKTDQVLASAALSSVSSINVTSTAGNTSLTVDTSSFGNAKAPPITFTGGKGNNTLTVTGTGETDWDISGANAGTVNFPGGPVGVNGAGVNGAGTNAPTINPTVNPTVNSVRAAAAISFTGVSNLTGGSTNTNVFTVEQGGALTGTLGGIPGGNDSLVFNNYTVDNAAFTASGPHSGSINMDGSVFTYAGLKPVFFNGNATNVTVTGTGTDVLSLADTATPGQIEIASLNNSLESITFSAPSASLTVDLNGGTDSLQVGELRLSGASLTVNGGGGNTSIAVDSGAYVSTRQTTGDTLGATSFGNSGNVSLNADTITVNTGAELFANANNGFTAGSIALDATATGNASQAATAGVAVHGAEVDGGSVALESVATTTGTVTQTTLATLDLTATAQTVVDGASLIGGTVGTVDVGTEVDVNGQVTANAAPLGLVGADAAVALADVSATATTLVTGTTVIGAIGDLSVHSDDNTMVTTLADGSAGGASAVGGTVALSDVTTGSTAQLGTGVRAFAQQMVVAANSTTTVSTRAIATAGGATANGAAGQGALASQAMTPDGGVTVAAAIAGTTDDDTVASSVGAANIATTQGLEIAANASRTITTIANASAVQGGPGVGAAVALNAISDSTNATLDGTSSISGDVDISVGQLRTPDAFEAVAQSGAGTTDVGVAGALAVNAVSDSAFGGLAAGANVDLLTGSLTADVTQTGEATTGAIAFLAGSTGDSGVGASVAIAPVSFSAETGMQAGAQLQTNAAAPGANSDASFTVTASRTIDTIADGGVAGGTPTAASLALTVAHDNAGADLDAGAMAVVEGNFTLDAQQTSAVRTAATAISGAQAAVVGFGIVLDNTQATTAGEIQASGDVSLIAEGRTVSTTTATGGPAGAAIGSANAPTLIASELAFLNNPAGVALPTPASADGTFGVAAALALGVAIGRVSATVSPVAGAPETITAEQISLIASGSVAATTRADAAADNLGGAGGIGAALALQTGQAIIVAEDDAPISAPIIILSAAGPSAAVPVDVGDFTVQAISGAGATAVGVAGAMAIGGDGITVQALLNGAAAATGSVSLQAAGHSTSKIDATALSAALPTGGSSPLGVGASFALDITDATITAAIEDGGSVTGSPTLSVAAVGGQTATTTAVGGAVGGTATGAAFALAVVTDEITAELTAKAVADAGLASLTANGASDATTTANADGGGQAAAIGAGLALGITVDHVTADVAGELVATGNADLTATGGTTQQTTADAGARGAAAGGLSAGLLLGNLLAFLNDPNGITAPTLATADGTMGVAAALAFGVDDSTTQTEVSGRLGTPDTLTMTATGGTTEGSTATAIAVDSGLTGTGIAAAVGVMVATPTISSRIDGRVIAGTATLSAGMLVPAGQSIQSHALSGVGNNDTGVAGALALTVAHPVTEAAIGVSGFLDDLGGDATLSASSASQERADAAAANLGSGKFGLGASMALDIALDDTHARLEQGAQVTHAQDLNLTAEGGENSDATANAGGQSGGSAGAVAINVAPQDVVAEIDPGTALKIAGNLSLEASQVQFSSANASGGAGERGGGFGAAIAVNAPVASTTALLDRGATVGNDILVQASSNFGAQAIATAGEHGGASGDTADQEVANWLGAAGGDGSTAPPVLPSIASAIGDGAQQLGLDLPSIGSAAALGVDAAFGTTSASITGGAAVTAGGNVAVLASGGGDADATANARAVNGLDAVGFGFAVDYDAQTIEASIGTATLVTALGITVEADVPRDGSETSTAEAMAGAGALAGVAGAVALNLVDNSTDAQILGTAPIDAPNFIDVEAAGNTDAAATAGDSIGGTVAGAGVSLAANLVVDHTEASVVAGARLDSLGTIRIEADGTQSMQSEAAGTASAGLAAIPASLTADALLATTAASVGDGARIDMGGLGTTTQNLLVLSRDITTLDAMAGSLGVAGLVGAGAAAQFSDLVKQTTADVDGKVQTGGSVIVEATSAETGLTQADAGALGVAVSVAGGAGVQMGQLLTHAAIDGDAVVFVVGDVVVTASDMTEMDVLAGGMSAALAASAGAGIGAIGLIKTTEALVENNAVVDAEGQGAGTQVATGFTISFVPDNPGPGQVATPFQPLFLADIFSTLVNNFTHNLLTPVGAFPGDSFADNARVATPQTTLVHGLAVTALSHDDLAIETSGLGAAGLAALELSASGVADTSTTQAAIEAGALINQRGFPGSAAQSVLVDADGDAQVLAVAGSVPLSGLAAVGPAGTLLAIDPVTLALIGAGAKVAADDGITVTAVTLTDLLGDATSAVLSTIGAAGSADAVVLGGHTYAYIDANALVVAGGSVSVLADNSSTSQTDAGVVATGANAVAAGASAGISLVSKDTEAWIGADAHVYSLGAVGEAVTAIDADPGAASDTTMISGVSVLASADELVMDLVANGSGGTGGAAFIGSAAGVVIGNTTAAFIAAGAVVRAGVFAANGAPVAGSTPKTVAVGAVDQTHSWDGVANLIDADLAISGAADAGVIRNTTDADVDAGANIRASGDVDVAALSSETADSFVGGLGLTNGGIELNVSASVYSIGAVVPGDLLDPLASVGGPGNLEAYLDGLLQGFVSQAGNGLVGVLNKYAVAVGGQQAAATQLAGLTPITPVTTAFTATNPGAIGTVANVDAARVTAFGKVEVTATDTVTPDLDTSYTFSHSFGSNSQNLNLSLDGGFLAARANATASVTDGSNIQSLGDIDITGTANTASNVSSSYSFDLSTANAVALAQASGMAAGGAVSVSANMTGSNKYSALLPGFSGLKIRLSYNQEDNTTAASVTDGSVIDAVGAVTVSAVSNTSDNVKADGATLFDDGFAGAITLGVALAWNNLADTTDATIDHSTVVADSVAVTANATTNDFAFGLGAADGDNNDVAISGSAARNILNDTVSATIENSTVTGPDGVVVGATDLVTLLSISGAAVARTEFRIGGAVSGQHHRRHGDGRDRRGQHRIEAISGDIQVDATGTATMSALAAGFAEGKNFVAGVGLPVDNLGMVIDADVVGGSVLGAGADVTVDATGDGTIMTLSGGVAIATSQVGFGAAVSDNNSTESVTAEVSDSRIVAVGSVDVEAVSDPAIDAIALGFAYAPTVAAAGSVALNTIDDTVTASVDDKGGANSVIIAGGGINVSATDSPNIEVLTGGVGLTKGEVSVAGSVSTNNINDTVNVAVSGARLTAVAGPIIVQGVSSANILAIAIAAAGAKNFAGSGAVTVNNISSTLDVTVGDVLAVLTAPTVVINGADSSTIGAVAFGISAAQTVAASGSVATNNITGGMVVQLDAAGHVVAQVAQVGATNTDQIKVITGAADGAGTASGGAAVSVNNITDHATAEVVGGVIDARTVSVTANQSGLIQSLAAIGSGAGTADIVASVTTNNIYDAATAIISTGAVIASGPNGSLTLASTNGGEIDSFSGAVNGAGTAAIAAAVANNNVSEQASTPGGATTELMDSTVTGGTATVQATDSATINSIAISGGGAGTAAFGGSVAKSNGRVTATISVTGDTQTLTGAVTIAALDNGLIKTAAANAEGAGTAAGGAAIAINTLTNNVSATLGGGTAQVGSLSITADGEGESEALAVVGGGAGTIDGVVSDTENTISGGIGASITGGAIVHSAGAVQVGATDHSTVKSLSGAASGAGTAALAGARAHNRIGDVPNDTIASDPHDTTPPPASTSATIDDGSRVVGTTVAVAGAFDGDIETLALAGGAAGTASIVGSLTDNLIGDQVSSSIAGSTTRVFATGVQSGAIDVTAANDATIQSLAGGIAVGGSAAGGAAGAVNKLRNAADASIDGALVDSLTGNVAVRSTGGGEIKSLAAAGGISSTISVGAAVSLNDLENDISAEVIDGATVLAAGGIAISATDGGTMDTGAASLAVSAGFSGSGAVATNNIADQVTTEADNSTLHAIAGTVSLASMETAAVTSGSDAISAGEVGVTATVSVNEIGNVLQATIDASTVAAGNNVFVQSSDTSTIESEAGQISVGVVGVGGAAAYNQIENTVSAGIEGGSTVTTPAGDVLVKATEAATIDTLAAGGSAGFVGVGGSVSVSIIANAVVADISASTVTAYGNVGVIANDVDGIDAYGGQISGGAVGVGASVAVLTLESQITAEVDKSTIVALGHTAPLMVPDIDTVSGDQTVASASGLVVAARDVEEANVKALSVSAGFVALAGTVADIHTANVTDAHILASQINSASGPGSGVFVHAAQATDVTGYIGNVAGGAVAIGAAVQVSTIDNKTQAYIADQQGNADHPEITSSVYANRITVSTATHEHVSANTVGIVGGFVGVGGSVAYSDIASTNTAFVRDSLLDARNGAAAITVAAVDHADVGTFAGNVAVGFVGAGAAVGASTIDNVTLATLIGAQLNANGQITVSSDSTEALSDTVGGGAAGFVGVAGSILVEHIGSDTEATVTPDGSQGTLINQDPSFGGNPGREGGSSAQNVNIEASDDASIDGKVGVVAAGVGAAGATIQVGSIADHLGAEVEAGSLINAAGNVSVTATSQRTADGYAFSATGGLISLNGAFSVLSIGGSFDTSTVSQVNSADSGNSAGLGSEVNGAVAEVPATKLFDHNDSPVAKNAAQELNALGAPTVGNPLGNSANVSGTFATVDDTGTGAAPRIVAGGNITISANSSIATSVTAGSVGGGLVTLGAGVALVTVTETTKAGASDGAVLSAGRDINVSASDATMQPTDVQAYTGTVGFVAAGGAVSHTTLTLDVEATLGPNVTVLRAAGVNVTANQSADLSTGGFDAAGGAVAAGGVDSQSIVQGTVVASVGQGSQLGTVKPIGTLTIATTADDVASTSTTAGSGGILAGEVNSAISHVTPTLLASLGDDTNSQVAGAVSITAVSTGSASAVAKGTDVGGLALGLSKADAELRSKASAAIGQGAHMTAGGDVTIEASHATTGNVNSSAASSGGGLISGNGAVSTAIDDGSAAASVGDDTTIDAGGTLRVWSTAVNDAVADSNTLSIGLVAVGGQVSTADSAGLASSHLGDGTSVQAYALEVEAAASSTSQSTSDAAAGGILSGTGAVANVDASPDASASVGEQANIKVQANADIIAVGMGDAEGVTNGTDGALIGSVGESKTNTTGTPIVSALVDQNSVIAAGGGVHVLAESPLSSNVSNGRFNAASGVELAQNLINFTGVTLLQTGDQVVYNTNGGTPIGGLTDGRTYSVLLANPEQITLGQQFSAAQVDAATSTIQFGKPDGFMTGDKVVYSSNGGPAIGGLVNGTTYYVRVINSTTIKLATSLSGAIQGAETLDPTQISAGGLILMVANGFTNGEAVTYRTTGAAIAGLVNGETYFVQRVNANQFRLSALPGGPAIVLGMGAVAGLQTLGAEGVALDGVGVTRIAEPDVRPEFDGHRHAAIHRGRRRGGGTAWKRHRAIHRDRERVGRCGRRHRGHLGECHDQGQHDCGDRGEHHVDRFRQRDGRSHLQPVQQYVGAGRREWILLRRRQRVGGNGRRRGHHGASV